MMTNENALNYGVTGVAESEEIDQVRPTWRQPEVNATDMFLVYNDQVLFKIVDSELIEIPYGTSGRVSPDYNKLGHIVDVKNY